MRYRVTCLTPTLVGDGRKLAPIDYMVWKNQVNVLDQNRILRLLAKGPRLEGYLSQIRKAEKLDFASWGGFAQNFAGRRIPFEDANAAQYWEKSHAENLFIPTFASGPHGAYLPASAVKGVLRTALLHGHASEEMLAGEAERAASEGRVTRRATVQLEEAALGRDRARVRELRLGDSGTVPESAFQVYLLRVSTLEPRGKGAYELAWKQSPRGSSRRPDDSTPIFAEMAKPGTVFEGVWNNPRSQRLFTAANAYTLEVLRIHKQYAESAALGHLKSTIEPLEQRVTELAGSQTACIAPLGWGAGFLSKTMFLQTESPAYRQILRQVPLFARAIQSGLPFPKTRKIVFLGSQPATLPGFVQIEIA